MLPALVAWSPKARRFVKYTEAKMDRASIAAWADLVATGRVKTTPLGKDYAALVGMLAETCSLDVADETEEFDIDMDDMVNELRREEAEKKRIAAEELKKDLDKIKSGAAASKGGGGSGEKKKKKKKVKVEGGYDEMDL